MKSRRKIIVAIITLIILLLGITMCTNNLANPNNKPVMIDPNIKRLKDLIYQEELCDDKWAKKIANLGEKMRNDSNGKYLVKYYQHGKITSDFISDYEELGRLAMQFGDAFIAKNYQKASNLMKDIKKLFIKLGGYSNEAIY